ncbi:MAG TPA: hypothetical protein VFM13_00205 [Gaiellaceae bacterium]|nr:hypothetical protein [Gaiellaceae bacterium]
MNTVERGHPLLIAAGIVVAGFLAAIVLIAMDIVLIGILVGALSIPLAFVAWLTAGDRY